jgi:hypothetical protein
MMKNAMKGVKHVNVDAIYADKNIDWFRNAKKERKPKKKKNISAGLTEKDLSELAAGKDVFSLLSSR